VKSLPLWLRPRDLATHWGLSERTIQRYVRQDGLPAAYYGRRMLLNIGVANSWANRRSWVRQRLRERGRLHVLKSVGK